MTRIILSDLDSTVAHTLHRAHLMPEDRAHGDWVPYSLACLEDPVIEGTAQALRLFSESFPVYFVSGRSFEAIQPTLMWLDQAGIIFESLRLRRPQDPRDNGDFKVAYIRELRAEGLEPVLMLEDWPPVVEKIEAETGVPVLCVNPRYHHAPADDGAVAALSSYEWGGLHKAGVPVTP